MPVQNSSSGALPHSVLIHKRHSSQMFVLLCPGLVNRSSPFSSILIIISIFWKQLSPLYLQPNCGTFNAGMSNSSGPVRVMGPVYGPDQSPCPSLLLPMPDLAYVAPAPTPMLSRCIKELVLKTFSSLKLPLATSSQNSSKIHIEGRVDMHLYRIKLF